MRLLYGALIALCVASCSSAPSKVGSPKLHTEDVIPPRQQPVATNKRSASCKQTYAPAQEDLSKRGNYRAGGLYAPSVVDSTPDYVPNIDCIAEPNVTDEARSPIGNRSPYTVLGKKYEILDDSAGYVEQGLASYYGNKFHGRRTSNQEVYDMYAFTAAHKSLPLPSFARVTNLDNGQSLVVRVNDRGPFHPGRIIDLSYAAAVKLGITQKGTGRVEVRALTAKDRSTTATSISSTRATVASSQTSSPTLRFPATSNGATPTVEAFDTWMRDNGVRVATGKPAAALPQPSSAPPATVATPTAPLASVVVASNAAQIIQIQVASYASYDNAMSALARLKAAGIASAQLSEVQTAGRKLWRLRMTAEGASKIGALLAKLETLGFAAPQVLSQ